MNKSIMCGFNGSKVSGNDWIGPVVMLGALGIGGYFLYTFLKTSTPGAGTTANNAAVTTTSAATAASALQASQASGVVQSINDTTLNGYATSLTNLITTQDTFPVDADTAMQIQNIVVQMNTATDWLRLVQLFGTKNYNAGGSQSLCSWFAINCQQADLPGLLKVALPPSNINTINSYFSDTFGNVTISI